MKRKHKKVSLPSTPTQYLDSTESSSLHFRLCHVCLHLNESAARVTLCQKCSHTLNPGDTDSKDMFPPDWDPFMDSPAEEQEELGVPNVRVVTPGIAGLDVRW